MALNITTKYRVANQWIDDKLQKDKFEFENKGNIGVGKLSWSIQEKKGGEVVFKTSKADFICFGENISIFENNLGANFNIEGSIFVDSYTNKKGETVYPFKIKVWKASVVDAELKPINSHNQAKANGYVKQDEVKIEDDFDDDIPF
tara:strand:+ start:46 stop:483 length:438 start_codon:yes stop_codon:yes gene_type:complete